MKLFIALIIQIQVFSIFAAGDVEFSTDLNDSQTTAKRVERQLTSSSCRPPYVTPDITFSVRLANSKSFTDQYYYSVDENATILSHCNVGYAFDYKHEEYYELHSDCKNSSWQPPILKCKRICYPFTHFGKFNMTCHQYVGGPKISCTGLLLEGAIVKPRCQQKYHPDKNVDYEFATCQADGTWDESFFQCIPECGAVARTAAAVNLIAYGEPEKRGGAPWNVAIYSAERNPQTPQFICGGTLITAELVISAAHCFFNEQFRLKLDIGFFYGIVANLYSNFQEKTFTTTKTYKFRNIYYPDEVRFDGPITSYAGDIVILQLSEKVTFSSDVFPACLDWDKRDRFNPGENVKGKLSGFGEQANGTLSSVLLTANLPYISNGVCKEKVGDDFGSFVSTDKFCAGSVNGSGAQKGDSGGGLLFIDKASGLYHLRGVVSNRDSSELSNIATFTDIAQYMTWIIKIKEGIDDESKLCRCNPDGSLSSVCDSKTGNCQCKAFVTGKNCDTCKDGYWRLQSDSPNGCVDCGCSSMGSYSSICDKTNGSCQCKSGVIGRQCDECVDNVQVLDSNGCEDGPKWLKFAHGKTCSNAVVGGYEPQTYETLFVVRHQVEDSILPGKLIPTRRVARIPWQGHTVGFTPLEHQFSEYEVLCGGLVEWIEPFKEKIPRGAVLAGTYVHRNSTSVISENVYVCRALFVINTKIGDTNLIIPGQLIPFKVSYCHIPGNYYFPSDHQIYHYEVLVQYNTTACECDPIGSYGPTCERKNESCKCKPNVIGKNCDRCVRSTYQFGPDGCKEDPKWLKFSDGNTCSNAVVVDKLKSPNVTILITRWRDDDKYRVFPGILDSNQKLLVSWNDGYDQRVPPTYEVFCGGGGSTKWVPIHKDLLHLQTLVLVEYVDFSRTRNYICRGKTINGFAPGTFERGYVTNPEHECVCVVRYVDKEYYLNEFEVLMVE